MSAILTFLFIATLTSAMIHVVYSGDDKDKKEEKAKAGDGDKAPAEKKLTARERREAERKKTALDRFREKQAALRLQIDTIPDSLLHTRWKIQKTVPVTYDDLKQGAADLKRPENLKQEVEYNDTLDCYVIGSKLGRTWVAAPIMMDLPEYQKWSEKSLFRNYFRQKNNEIINLISAISIQFCKSRLVEKNLSVRYKFFIFFSTHALNMP